MTFSIDSDVNTVAEGGNVTFTISLDGSGSGAGPFALQTGETASIDLAENNGPAPATTSADYDSFLDAVQAVADARADLSFDGTTLTVTGTGSPTADVVATITATDDSLIEGSENFNVVLSGPATTTGADVQLDAAAASEQIEITDNDTAVLDLSGATTIGEGGIVAYTVSATTAGTVTAPFILQADETITYEITLTAEDTINPDDFAGASYNGTVVDPASPLATITIVGANGTYEITPAGPVTTTGSGTTQTATVVYTQGSANGPIDDLVVSLETNDDNLIEGEEDYSISIGNLSSSADPQVSIDTTADDVTTTIEDNDTANFTLAQSSSSINEGDAVTFTLTLDGSDSGAPGAAAVQAGNTASVDIGLTLLGPTSFNDFDENTDQSVNESDPLVAAINQGVAAFNSNAGVAAGDDGSFGFDGTTITWYGDGTTPTLDIVLDTFEDEGSQQGAGSLTHLSNLVEPDEQFQVSISNPQFDGVAVPGQDEIGTAGDATLTTTIVDDNTTEVVITAIQDGREGFVGSEAEEFPDRIDGLFEITLTNPSQNEIVVTLTDGVGNSLIENGTAANDPTLGLGNDDYQNTSLANVIFAPGDQSEIASVDVVDDFVTEGDETVVATLGTATFTVDSFGAIPSPGDVSISSTDNSDTLTIIDDDSAVLTVGDATINEDDGTVTVEVTLESAVQNGFTVPYTLTDGSATGGDDFDNVISGVLTFAGTAGEVQEITVDIIADDVVEPDETFTVGLGTITPGLNTTVIPGVATVDPADVDTSDTGTVTIVNDDTDITISVSDAAVDESNVGQTSTITFTVNRVGLTTGTTTATYTVTSSEASADDFDGGAFPTGTVTFAPGETTATIEIVVAGDNDVEFDEDFTVTLSAPSDTEASTIQIEPDASAVGTIVNDDIDVTIAADAAVVDEGNNGDTTAYTFTVTRDGDTTGETTVDYAVTGSGANPADANDFGGTFPSGTVTFAAGATTATITVNVSGDNDVELDENFTVTLSNGSDSQTNHIVEIEPDASADGTIVNDDIDVTIAADAAVVDEGNNGDTTAYTFTVTRDGDTTGETTVDYAVTGSGANPADANDFGGTFPSGTVTFAAGATTATITVNVSGDNDVELDENFTVTLSNGSDSQTNHIVEIEPDASADGTIVNDDIDLSIAPGPELFENDDDSGTPLPPVPAGFTAYDFLVTRTGDLDGTTTSDYAVVGSGANPADADDFGGALPTGTVTFAPGESTATIRVLVSEDSDVENDEGFTVNLSNPDDSQPDHIVEFIPDPAAPGSTAALGFIVDGDTFSQPFSIVNNSAAGVDVLSFTLDISATGQNYDTNPATGVPFTPVAPTDADTGLVGPVTVPDGATTFTLNFTDFNSGETFQWDIDVDTVGQNNPVFGNQLIGATATIEFSDGNVVSGILEAVPGNGDAAQFNVTGVSLQVASASATILNDDIDIDFAVGLVDVEDEGTGADTTFTFEVTRDGFITGSTADTTVDFVVAGTGPNAATAEDFGGAFPSGSVTFGPDDTTATITVVVTGDSLAEFDENFTVTLSNPVNADPNIDSLDITNDVAEGGILNDDTSQLEVADVFLQETQGGTTTAVFRVSIGNGVLAAEDLIFDFTTMDGTAISGSDFEATSGTATIVAGESFVDIPVTVFGDTDVELDESFSLVISDPAFAGDVGDSDLLTGGPGADGDSSTGVAQVEITDDTGVATINNDDALVEFVVPQSTQSEAGGPTGPQLFIRGDLTDVPDEQRFVTLQTVGGTAIRGLDYFFADGDNNDVFEFLIPAGDFSGGNAFDLTLYDVNGELTSVSGLDPILDIVDDNLIEGEENIVIEIQGVGDVFTIAEAVDPDPLNAPADPAGFNPDTNHVIGDNDFATISVIPTDVTEEGGTQTFNIVLNTGGAILAPTITGIDPGVTITADVIDVLGGTASASDFTFNTQSITFNPGEGDGETRTLEITPTSDEIVEPDETVAIDFTNTNAGFLGNANTQVTFVGGDITILEDATDTAILTVDSATFNESDGTVTVDVTLDAEVEDGFTVEAVLTNITTSSGDFVSLVNPQVLTFSGGIGEVQQVTFTINDDTAVEGIETFEISLDNLAPVTAPAALIDTSSVGTVTINEDANDTAVVTVSNATFDESAGTVTVDVTVDAAVEGGFTVDATLTNITTESGDTVSVSPQTLTFAGNAGEVQTVTLSIVDDAIVELAESLEISLDNLSTATAPAASIDISSVGTVTINEDSADVAVVTVDSVTVDENAGTITVDVTLDAAVEGGFTVDATLTDITTESGDTVSVNPQTLTFAGNAGEVQTVTLTIVDDAIVELAESLDISLGNLVVTSAPASAIDISSVGTVTINEDADDVAAVTVDSVAVDENAGTITVDVTLDAAVEGGFTVDATLTDITTESGDTVSVSPQTLTFAGNAGEVQTVTLTIVDDAIVELAETLDISLDNLVVTSAPASAIDISSVGTVTINEDSADVAAATVDSVTVNEDAGTITVEVTLDAAVEGGFTVDAILTDVTTEAGDTISTSPQTLTFSGNVGEVQTVTLTIEDDSIVEFTESLEISLTNLVVTAAPASAIDISSVGTVAIEDNDEAVITLTAVETEASELPDGTGVTNGEFLLQLSNESSTATVIDFTATPDSNQTLGAIRAGFETSSFAHLQGDYRILADGVEVTGNTFTIPAGTTDVVITIEVIDDVVVETIENFDLTLTGINSADPDISIGSAVGGNVTITDDDQAEIVVKAIQDASEPGQSADDNGFFQVLLVVPGSVDSVNPNGIPAPVSYDIEVLFSVTGTANQIPGDSSNPVDFEELESVQFAPGTTIDVIAVTPEDDLIVEADETVDLTLTPNTVESNILDNLFNENVTDVTVTTTPDHQSATVVIQDNDFELNSVSSIFVNSVDWDALFRDRLDGTEDGIGIGYELSDEVTVPWINIDQIIVQFDGLIDAASVDISDFELTGIPGFNGDFSPGVIPTIDAVTVGPNNTVVLDLSQSLEAAELSLDVSASGITFGGQAGTNSVHEFVALPGDANQDGIVNGGDLTDITSRQNSLIFAGGTFLNFEFFSDVNGDAIINGTDLTEVVARQNSFVSITSPSTLASSFSLESNLTAENPQPEPTIESSSVLSLSGSIDSNFASQDEFFEGEFNFGDGSEGFESSGFEDALVNDLATNGNI